MNCHTAVKIISFGALDLLRVICGPKEFAYELCGRYKEDDYIFWLRNILDMAKQLILLQYGIPHMFYILYDGKHIPGPVKRLSNALP